MVSSWKYKDSGIRHNPHWKNGTPRTNCYFRKIRLHLGRNNTPLHY